MSTNRKEPIYPISVAAKLVGVHPRTLRIYEDEGLVKPARIGNKRYFSEDDIEWIRCLRHMIHDEGISIPGIKKLLELTHCWEIKNCPPEKRDSCSAYLDRTLPCWERAGIACAKGADQCEECEVYVSAMKEASSSLIEKRAHEKAVKAEEEAAHPRPFTRHIDAEEAEVDDEAELYGPGPEGAPLL